MPASPVLGWPLVAFGVLIVIPLLRGHYSYGAHVLGQPLRLIALRSNRRHSRRGDSGARLCACCVSSSTRARWSACSGRRTTSRPVDPRSNRSTCRPAGSRPLAISTSLYCAGALFLALLTVRTAPSRARSLPHLVIAGLGLVGVVLGFGRGVFAAVAIVLVVFLVASKGIRRGVLVGIPLALPIVLLAAVFVMHTAPAVVTSFQHRISAPPAQDANVIWRERANAAVLAQVREQPLVGVGFGRGSSFYISVKSASGFLVPVRQDIGQDPHDGYLFLLAGGGILALGSFLALIAVFAIDAWRRYRGSIDDTERLLILWACATLFCFLFEAGSGTMFEFPSDLLPIWALLVLPGLVPLQVACRQPAAPARPRVKPLRILAVSMSARPHGIGGMEDHLHTLTEELSRRGHEVSVITARHPDGIRSETIGGVEWIYIDSDPHWLAPRWDPELDRAVQALLGTRTFDVLHSQSSSALSLVRRPVPGQPPIVLSLHGNYLSIVAEHHHD